MFDQAWIPLGGCTGTPRPSRRPTYVPTNVPTEPLPYYVDLNSGTCLHDGKQSEFTVQLYDTLDDCVSYLSSLVV